jgi:hypothetical protein
MDAGGKARFAAAGIFPVFVSMRHSLVRVTK